MRVVGIGNESLEFCGGTHVRRAGDIGLFKILGEAGVAQGVRRIEAVTGAGALDYLRRIENELGRPGERLKAQPFEVAARVDKLLADQQGARSRDREAQGAARVGRRRARSDGRDRDREGRQGPRRAGRGRRREGPARHRRPAASDKLGSGVVVLAGTGGAEVKLVAMVTKDLAERVPAGKLLGEVAAALGGRAGGRADMAQGGGKDASAAAARRSRLARKLGRRPRLTSHAHETPARGRVESQRAVRRSPSQGRSAEQCQDLVEYISRLSWQAHTADTSSMGDGYGEARFMYEKEFTAAKGPELLRRCQTPRSITLRCARVAEQLDQVIARCRSAPP